MSEFARALASALAAYRFNFSSEAELQDGVERNPVLAYFLLAEHGSDPIVADILGIKRRQCDGVINPGRDLIEELQKQDDHIRRAAEAYLQQLGRPHPG